MKIKSTIFLGLSLFMLGAHAADYLIVVPLTAQKHTDLYQIEIELAQIHLPTATTNVPYMHDFSNQAEIIGDKNESKSLITWSLEAGNLPTGLTINSKGQLAGIPTEPGTKSFTVRAGYKTKSAKQSYDLTVAIANLFNAKALPIGYANVPYAIDIRTLINNYGGYVNPAVVPLSIESPLPIGLVFSNGSISGISNTEYDSDITIAGAFDGVPHTIDRTLKIYNPIIDISAINIPKAYYGEKIVHSLVPDLKISGDPYPDPSLLRYSSSGLPLGLSIDSNGNLVGTSTATKMPTADYTIQYRGYSKTVSLEIPVGVKVLNQDGVRSWADQTTAGSCNEYRTGNDVYEYVGDTGSGIYKTTTGNVYCDMESDGGGWTLLMKQAKNDGTTLQGDSKYWTNGTVLNDTAPNQNLTNANLVSAAFSSLPITQLRLQAANETTMKYHSIGASRTAKEAFSNTYRTTYSDWFNAPNTTNYPDWFIRTANYPNNNPILLSRFGFNYQQYHATYGNCSVRWGWSSNENPISATDREGSHDACGGLGGYGAPYGGVYMNNNKNAWQPATLYLWGK